MTGAKLNPLYFIMLASILVSMPLMEAHGVMETLKINEVEMNPGGPVTENQWMELFNQGDDLVNIGSWLVKSTKLGKTFSIPEGFVVLPRDYLVVPFGSVMLDHESESVVLLTADSVEVDRTPLLSDTDHDDRTWQRFPDGVDTDTELDWQFRNSTIGRYNGFHAVEQNFTLSAPLLVDQSGNKVEAFSAGQMAGIKSEIVNKFQDERVFTYIVKITDEEGITVFLSWVEDLTVLPDRTVKPAIFWLVEEKGNFLVETFVWRSLNLPEVLASSQSGLVRIAG